MRVVATLLLLLASATCPHAATSLRVAILDDDLPGREPSLVAHVRHSLQRGGYTVATLKAIQLANASVLARDRYDVLMLLHCRSFPGRASRNVEAFLQAGGHLVLVGGFAYSRPVARVRGAWRDRAEFDAALHEVRYGTPLFQPDALDPAV